MNDDASNEIVKYKWRKRIITSIFILFWLFVTLGAVFNVITETKLARNVLADNTSAVAVILDKEHKVTQGRKGRETHKYYLSLEYSVNNNKLNTNSEVDMKIFDTSSIGKKVNIIYQNSDPKEAGFIEQYKENANISAHLMSLLGVPIIFLVILFYLRKAIFWIVCRG